MEALLANLPFVLLFLLCPLMMLFMHRGGGHEAHGGADHAGHHDPERAELARRLEASKEQAKT